MNLNLEEELYQSFPKLFAQKELDHTKTCMCWGIECPNEWFQIIKNACINLQKICDEYGYQIEFTQIKEKFGGLRMYFDFINGTPDQMITEVYNTVDLAEKEVYLLQK